MGRFEFTIDNPDHLRGQGKPFELQAKQADETWKTAYKGSVYGTICGKRSIRFLLKRCDWLFRLQEYSSWICLASVVRVSECALHSRAL